MDRRTFLIHGGAAAAGLLAGSPAWAAAGSERRLAFVNTHTGERLRATYWAAGRYLADGLAEIDRILRDHRTGDVLAMDRGLLDLLHAVHARLGTSEPFHLISGYRSPRTNAKLRSRGRGVATRSLHLVGKAADVRIPGVSVLRLRDVARELKAGGVGCYPGPEFVHVDVGRVRYW